MKYVMMGAFLLLGLLAVGFGSFALRDHYRQGRVCTKRVAATVSNVERKIESTPRSKGKRAREYYSYTPVLTYTVNGVVYDNRAPISDKSPTAFLVGMKVTIMYNPDNPSDFYLEEHRIMGKLALMCIAIGVVFILVTWHMSRVW